MSQEQVEEIQSLLWSYKDVKISDKAEQEKIVKIQQYLLDHRIPLSKLRTIFKGKDEEMHFNAINAAAKLACNSIQKNRFRKN